MEQHILCEIFADVLGVAGVDADDNFFALGGHSMPAIRLVNRVQAMTGVDLSVRDLFQAPTVAAFGELIAARHAEAAPRPALAATGRTSAPLSYAQHRLWYLAQVEGPSATYAIPIALGFGRPVRVDALARALDDLIERHQVLRTVYPQRDGVPRQEILEPDAGRVRLGRLACAASDLDEVMARAVAEPMDITTTPPVRAWLIATEPADDVLLLVIHHIASDGGSTGPLLRDLLDAYRARCGGARARWTPLPAQYIDFSVWQRSVLGDEADPRSVLARQAAYWQRQLAGVPEQLRLPADRRRPPVATHGGAVVTFTVDAALHESLTRLALAHRCTLFMVLEAAVALWLAASGAGADIPLGTPVAGRGDSRLDDVVGFFANTLVLRNDLSGDPTFREVLGRVREMTLDAYAHQDVPFERLVELLNPVRSLARHPVFQVTVSLSQDGPGPDPFASGIARPVRSTFAGTAKFDLSVDFEEVRDGLLTTIEYATDLFDRATVEAMADRLGRVLRAVVDDPDRPIFDLDLLSPDERRRIDAARTGPVTGVPPLDVVAAIARAGAERPEAVAVSGAGDVTYRQLTDDVRNAAGQLAGHGVGPGATVAVLAGPGAWGLTMAAAILGTGAAYLPVDPATPVARMRWMLATAGAGHLLASTDLRGPAHVVASMDGVRTEVIEVDLSLAPVSWAAPRLTGEPDRPAYVVFPSGGTARPEGVLIPRRALANRLRAAVDGYGLRAADVVAFDASAAPDAEVGPALAVLSVGGRVHVLDPHLAEDPVALLASVAAHGVTVLHLRPGTLGDLLDLCDSDDRAADLAVTVRLLVIGDGMVPADLVARWGHRFPDAALATGYGPAECAGGVAVAIHRPGRPAATGRPLADVRVHVLDRRLRPVPPGVTGELYVAGAAMALGFAGDAGLTAASFVADPLTPGGRMYRTGDLGRWTAAGELETSRRADRQARVHGVRLDLDGIAAILRSDPSVRAAEAVVREDRPGDRRLVAYVVASGDADAVGGRLRDVLPGGVSPTVVRLETLPLTPAGDVDRRALPAPGAASGAAPLSVQEQILCDLFAEVLGVDRVNADANFFTVGGHSMLAIQLVNRVRSVLGTDIGIRAFLQAPVVAEFSRAISAAEAARAAVP
jgi:amino acid adenylation domain-containing protein